MNDESNPNIDHDQSTTNNGQHGLSAGQKKRDLKEIRKSEENKLEVGDEQQDIVESHPTIENKSVTNKTSNENGNGVDEIQKVDTEPITNDHKRVKTHEEDIFVSNESDPKNETQEQPIITEGKNCKSYVLDKIDENDDSSDIKS